MKKNISARLLAVALTTALVVPQAGVSVQAAKKVNPTSIEITTDNIKLIKGKTKQLKAVVSPSKATNKKITWTTNKKSVVTVSKTGKIKAVGNGYARIYAKTANGISTYAKVKVGPAVSKITPNKTSITLTQGKTTTIKATATPKNAATTAVRYYSSNKKVMTVGMTKGKVTAKSAGKANIVIKAMDGSGKKITVPVTVKAAEAVTKITNKDVVNGVVTLSNKTYKNLAIDSSVGSAQINLDNVKITGDLTLADGAAYTVTAKDSEIANVVTAESTAVSKMTTGKVPTFVAGNGTKIAIIKVAANINVTQVGSGSVNRVLIAPKANQKLNPVLKGIKSNIDIEAKSNADVEIFLKECIILNASVGGNASGMKLSIKDGKESGMSASSITTLDIAGTTTIALAVNTTTVSIADKAVKTILEVVKGFTISIVKSNADNVSIKGDGEIKKAEVGGNNTSIDTKGTEVSVDKGVTGTTAGGKDVAAGETAKTEGTPEGSETINGGGGSSGGSSNTTKEETLDAIGDQTVQIDKAISDTAVLKVRFTDKDGKVVSGTSITWTSADTTIVSVNSGSTVTDKDGIASVEVTGKTKGTTTVTAGYGSKTVPFTVTVKEKAVPSTPVLETVTVTPNSNEASYTSGKSITFTATAKDTKGEIIAFTKENIKWSVSDTTGLIKGDVDEDGRYIVNVIGQNSSDVTVTVTAKVTVGEVTKDGTAEITIAAKKDENPDVPTNIIFSKVTDLSSVSQAAIEFVEEKTVSGSAILEGLGAVQVSTQNDVTTVTNAYVVTAASGSAVYVAVEASEQITNPMIDLEENKGKVLVLPDSNIVLFRIEIAENETPSKTIILSGENKVQGKIIINYSLSE